RPGPLTAGIDVGGSKLLAGAVDSHGQVLERLRRDTPTKSPSAVEDAIVEIVHDLASRHPVAAVGIGAAGFVDAGRANVLFSPHLAWRNEPLRDAVWRRLRLPIVVDNDANAAAWGESRFGAGAGRRHVVCITLGTGIGGALVLDGRVFRGANGMAGEFGHMQVVPGGHRCECGNRGCWEQYASGNALVRDARELVLADSPVAHHLRELVDGDVSRLTGPMVSEAARRGDPAAVELITEVGHWLGVGLAGLTAAFDPDCVIVGGGVSEAGELLLKPTRESFARTLTGRGFRVPPAIVAARLGADAGFVGAADLARSAARRSRRSSRRRSRLRTRRDPRWGQRTVSGQVFEK
ncbi:MAG TPA: ROK family glucokinase, partial [Nocardioidaceae bacterium]|nr:ROK family glucokinase [Nocardioidaceae bacterium]